MSGALLHGHRATRWNAGSKTRKVPDLLSLLRVGRRVELGDNPTNPNKQEDRYPVVTAVEN